MDDYFVKSFAKINLFLKILNKRADNYHNIHSLFLEIDFYDEIIFKPSLEFKITYEGINVPTDKTNLIFKAYQLISSKYNIKDAVSIHLKKNIPLFAGLGGGSSNAAQTLLALNKMWNLKIKKNGLERLGLSIGADVPFFINGGLQEVKGIGDKLLPLLFDDNESYFLLLVVPDVKISTKWAYEKINKYLHSNKKLYKFRGSLNEFDWELYDNDFEELVISTYPEIGKIKGDLLKSGAKFASLSGSGSTVFGVFSDFVEALEAERKFSSYQTIQTIPNMKKGPFGA